jgi:hypothetical protein
VTPATALLYHRLTSLEPGRENDPDAFVRGWVTPVDHPLLVDGFVPNVIDDWPAACKTYAEGLPAVVLPRDWPALGAPATAVLAGRHAAPRAPLDLLALARVTCVGVPAYRNRRGGRPGAPARLIMPQRR